MDSQHYSCGHHNHNRHCQSCHNSKSLGGTVAHCESVRITLDVDGLRQSPLGTIACRGSEVQRLMTPLVQLMYELTIFHRINALRPLHGY